MRLVDPAGGMEPIAGRIISVPDDQDRARMRDPNAGFTSYVPVGSLAKGKELVETGGGRSMRCTLCHGPDLKGVGSTPRLAGMHPVYTYRQLAWFKDGTRKGLDASFMVAPVARLTSEDMVNISAYLASLAP
jgi:cytochrome c553